MNYFITLENFLDLDKVRFYTVRLEDQHGDPIKERSETEEFMDTFHRDPLVKDEFEIIINIMNLMGQSGADKDLFRHEARADALPPDRSKLRKIGFDLSHDFQALRLYTMRLSDCVVVLFNGGIKTTAIAQDCPNVRHHFSVANQIAQAIDSAISNQETYIIGKDIFGKEFTI
ncbi:MAG: hypothetical protein IPL46_30815 [Saprospiraceae bacterium]|nr:hypothetical protein [Saprospiraceae bacterium]